VDRSLGGIGKGYGMEIGSISICIGGLASAFAQGGALGSPLRRHGIGGQRWSIRLCLFTGSYVLIPALGTQTKSLRMATALWNSTAEVPCKIENSN
jgi:hypothetical protein